MTRGRTPERRAIEDVHLLIRTVREFIRTPPEVRSYPELAEEHYRWCERKRKARRCDSTP